LVPLSDGAGEVVEIGSGVTRWTVGDRVAGCFFQGWIEGPITAAKASTALGGAIDGVLSETVVLHESGLVAVPNHLSFEEASCLPCAALTAWNALFETGRVGPGTTVLLQGTGGVSIFALQFAKAAGARVILTSSSDEKLERARSMGADHTINYRTEENWDKAAAAFAEVDLIVEVGGAGTLGRSLRAVRSGGQIVSIGLLTGGASELTLGFLLTKNITLTGIYVGSRLMFEAMNRAIAQHELHPVVDRTVPFEEAPAALAHLASGAHFGKVVISV